MLASAGVDPGGPGAREDAWRRREAQRCCEVRLMRSQQKVKNLKSEMRRTLLP